MRKNMHTRSQTNRRMSDSTYTLRRKVMGYVYEAKAVADFPRVDVRITDSDQGRILGVARMGDLIIWIPASSTGRSDLRHIVFHEIVHAVKAQGHVIGCPLMSACISSTTREQQDTAFRHYMA